MASIDSAVTDERLLALVKHFEGWRPDIYTCPAGYPTIGWGHVVSPGEDIPQTIDEATGERLLAADLRVAAEAVFRLAPNLADEPEHRAAALIAWTMNLGQGNLASSTMLKRIREGRWQEAAHEMRRWDKATVNGRKTALAGLTRRREAEARLFLTGDLEL